MNRSLGPISLLVCVVLLAACGGQNRTDSAASAPQSKQLSATDVLRVDSSEFVNSVPFTGNVAARDHTTVSAEVGGTVRRIAVKEGDVVQRGQQMALLDNESVRQSVAAQQAQLANSRANLDLARIKLKQQQVLFQKGFISKLALEQAQNEFAVTQGGVRAQQAELAKLQKSAADARIIAPMSGVVYERAIEEGQLVGAQAKLFSIADMSVLEITATLGAEQIGSVQTGQTVTFRSGADQTVHRGSVRRINPVADAQTRNFSVFIEVPNSENRLKAGQFAQGDIIIQSVPDSMVLPERAVQTGSDRKTFVYLVQGGKIVQQPVQVVQRNAAARTVAVNGLRSGSLVLSTQVLGVKAGDGVLLPKELK